VEQRPFATDILKELNAIRSGEVEDRFGWMVKVNH
jgi:hypothetical protein